MECAGVQNIVRHETPSTILLSLPAPEDASVAAYQETPFPAVILEGNTRKFQKIEFRDHPGYVVWCCEIVDDELRIALSKEKT